MENTRNVSLTWTLIDPNFNQNPFIHSIRKIKYNRRRLQALNRSSDSGNCKSKYPSQKRSRSLDPSPIDDRRHNSEAILRGNFVRFFPFLQIFFYISYSKRKKKSFKNSFEREKTFNLVSCINSFSFHYEFSQKPFTDYTIKHKNYFETYYFSISNKWQFAGNFIFALMICLDNQFDTQLSKIQSIFEWSSYLCESNV